MAINSNVLAENQATVLSEDGNTMYATIQMRHGKESEMDKDKFVPAEMGVATDTKNVFMAFAPGDVKEMALKEDIPEIPDPDYNDLTNKPSIGGVTVEGDKTLEQYGVQPKGNYLTEVPEEYVTDDELDTKLVKKLDKNQGKENSGKALVVGADGNVTPGEDPVKVDDTLTQPGQAADAKATGDRILNLAIHQTAAGNPITLTDAGEGTPVVDFSVDGKTEQVQTTGAQLFDFPDKEKGVVILNGITYTFNLDGSIAIKGTATARSYIKLANYSQKIKLPQGNYTIGIGVKCPSGSSVLIGEYNEEGGHKGNLAQFSAEIMSKTFAVSEESGNIDAYFDIGSGNTVNLTIYPMLNSGSEALPYEPYTGNQPSPSPDYPQEIVNGGNYNDENQKWEYEVSVRGSQLWRNIKGETTLSGVKLTPLADGWINFNGTCTSSANIALEGNHLESGNYTISAEKQGSLPNNAKALAQVYSPTGGNIRVSNNGFSSSDQLNEADDYQFRIRIDQGFTYNNVKVRVTLNEGLEALPYEPYRSPQTVLLQSDRPLTKWDRLEKRDGQWGWVYGSNCCVFKGDVKESWLNYDNQNYKGFVTYIRDMRKLDYNEGYCDIFKVYNKTTTSIGIWLGSTLKDNYSNAIYVYNSNPEIAESVEEFNTWLQTHNMTVWYPTAEEIFVPLTESEQSALEALTTYFPTTIISNDADCEMEIEYVADTKTYIDNKFAELAQNLAATQNTLLEV